MENQIDQKKVQKAVKQIEKKLGVKVQKNPSRDNYYYAIYKDHTLEFFTQEYKGQESPVCISSRYTKDQRDSQTDYFPEMYHDTVLGAIRSMLRCAS